MLDADIADAESTLQNEHYGVTWLSDCRKNMMLAASSLADKIELRPTRSLSNPNMESVPIMAAIRRVHEGHQWAKTMDWMDICNIPKLDKTTTS